MKNKMIALVIVIAVVLAFIWGSRIAVAAYIPPTGHVGFVPRISWVGEVTAGQQQRFSIGTLTFDSSYGNPHPGGIDQGEYLDPADFGFTYMIEALIVWGKCGGYMFQLEPLKNIVKVYYFDYNAGADGPAIEVPAGTNLSSLKPECLAIGW